MYTYIYVCVYICVCVRIYIYVFFRATPAAYGGSQTRGPIGAVADSLRQSHSNHEIRATSATYNTAHSNTGSGTH